MADIELSRDAAILDLEWFRVQPAFAPAATIKGALEMKSSV